MPETRGSKANPGKERGKEGEGRSIQGHTLRIKLWTCGEEEGEEVQCRKDRGQIPPGPSNSWGRRKLRGVTVGCTGSIWLTEQSLSQAGNSRQEGRGSWSDFGGSLKGTGGTKWTGIPWRISTGPSWVAL